MQFYDQNLEKKNTYHTIFHTETLIELEFRWSRSNQNNCFSEDQLLQASTYSAQGDMDLFLQWEAFTSKFR